MLGFFKTTLKRLRRSQPFNCIATSTIRTLLGALGARSYFIARHLHRIGTTKVKLPNGRTMALWSQGDDWVSNRVFWDGWAGYESETAPLFFTLAKRARVIVDVGAHVGFYTLLGAHANPEGYVYAFEPLPKIFERLTRNVAINRLSNIECVASAVGEFEGTADFYRSTDGIPSSSSLSFEFMRSRDNLMSIKVPVVRLDHFVKKRQLEHVDLIKIDTESTEASVLAGFGETLRRDRPNVVCEVLPGAGSETALERVFRSIGYDYYLLTPEGLIQRDRVEGHPEWLNYLFTPLDREAIARLWQESRVLLRAFGKNEVF